MAPDRLPYFRFPSNIAFRAQRDVSTYDVGPTAAAILSTAYATSAKTMTNFCSVRISALLNTGTLARLCKEKLASIIRLKSLTGYRRSQRKIDCLYAFNYQRCKYFNRMFFKLVTAIKPVSMPTPGRYSAAQEIVASPDLDSKLE